MTISKLAASAALLMLLGSCATMRARTDWVKGEAPVASQQVITAVTKMVFGKTELPVIGPGFDPVTRTMRSGWRTDLVPIKRQRTRGFRERAWVKYTPASDGKLSFEVRVEMQINKNLARPLDLQYADWEEGPDSEKRARHILQLLTASLRQGSRR
jgi:hypothetical protein